MRTAFVQVVVCKRPQCVASTIRYPLAVFGIQATCHRVIRSPNEKPYTGLLCFQYGSLSSHAESESHNTRYRASTATYMAKDAVVVRVLTNRR